MTPSNLPLDPAIQQAIQIEVRNQMAAALESLARKLRGGASPAAAVKSVASGEPDRPVPVVNVPAESKLMAILTSAAVVAMGGTSRVAIRRVTYLNQNTVSGWAEMGRAAVQSSHNIRRSY